MPQSWVLWSAIRTAFFYLAARLLLCSLYLVFVYGRPIIAPKIRVMQPGSCRSYRKQYVLCGKTFGFLRLASVWLIIQRAILLFRELGTGSLRKCTLTSLVLVSRKRALVLLASPSMFNVPMKLVLIVFIGLYLLERDVRLFVRKLSNFYQFSPVQRVFGIYFLTSNWNCFQSCFSVLHIQRFFPCERFWSHLVSYAPLREKF